MFRAYGGWTFAFKDYYELNFTGDVDDPNMATMCSIVDPYGKLQSQPYYSRTKVVVLCNNNYVYLI